MSDENESQEEQSPKLHERVSSLESSRRTWTWIVGILAPFMCGLLLWSVDAVRASSERVGETRASIDGIKHSLELLDLDVREIRARLLKVTGADPEPGLGVVAVGAP